MRSCRSPHFFDSNQIGRGSDAALDYQHLFGESGHAALDAEQFGVFSAETIGEPGMGALIFLQHAVVDRQTNGAG